MRQHKTTPLLLALVLALSACSTSQPSRFSDAATTPMADFNVGQDDIPSLLLDAKKHPYDKPADQSCDALWADVKALVQDALGETFLDRLGDLAHVGVAFAEVHVIADADASEVDRGVAFIGDTALGAFKGAVEGLVPYRSWIRKLSGAERHSREVATAIAAGTARRAFLKGLRTGQGCP